MKKSLEELKELKFIQKDRFNRDVGSFKNGELDIIPIAGKDLTITIDSELQDYGEQLMNGKKGGIVAIDPRNGEILSLVSAPSYNPNLLIGRNRSENYMEFIETVFISPL